MTESTTPTDPTAQQSTVSGRVRGAVADLVDRLLTIASGGRFPTQAVRRQLGTLGNLLKQGATALVTRIDAALAESDISVHSSDHRLQILGNDTGVQSIEATLREAFEDTDLHVYFDRDVGLDVEFQDASTSPEGTDSIEQSRSEE